MLKRLYEAGKAITQDKLPKFIRNQEPDEKRESTGMLGLALGGILQNIAYGGMALCALAAVIVSTGPAGLTVGAFAGCLALGTALAGVGIVGKGMFDAGDEMCGNIVQQSKEFRKGIAKAFWNDLRGRKSAFDPDAKPVSQDFTAAVAGTEVKSPAAPAPAPAASTPEMK